MVTKRKLRRRRQRKLKANAQIILDRLIERYRPSIEEAALKAVGDYYFLGTGIAGIAPLIFSIQPDQEMFHQDGKNYVVTNPTTGTVGGINRVSVKPSEGE